MTSRPTEVLLYGLFQRFRAAGLPLSARDFLEGLDALHSFREPFIALKGMRSLVPAERETSGAEPPENHPVRSRDELVWFCQALWARTGRERRLVRDVIMYEVDAPPPRLTLRAHRQLARELGESSPGWPEDPKPRQPEEDETESKESDKDESHRKEKEEGKSSGKGGDRKDGIEGDSTPEVGAETSPAGDLPIPHLDDTLDRSESRFIMNEVPIVSELWLTMLWRRLFAPIQEPDYREIDVEETARHASRTGLLVRLAFRTRRINAASLLVLLDESRTMAPWQGFKDMLRASLDRGSSRLAKMKIAHFVGAPGSTVYRESSLHKPVSLESWVRDRDFKDCAVFVFGDAGASGPARSDIRDRMNQFLQCLQANDVGTTVWVNPLPEERWGTGHMEVLSGYPRVHGLPLTSESLRRAIDLLRGKES